MNSNLLTVFIAVTSLAVILQTLILYAFYRTARKTAERLQALATRVEDDVIPAVRKVEAMVTENSARVNSIVENLLVTTGSVRRQVERLTETVDGVIDRTREHIVRADRFVSRTLERVEDTASRVKESVRFPVSRFSSLLDGLLAGISEYMGGRKVRHAREAVPQEDMFI